MNKKRILIVSASFYPQQSPRSFRTTELAKELARQGHEVVVYIPFRGATYSDFAKLNNIRIKNLGTLRFRDIIIKGSGLELLLRRGLRRFLGLFIEYPNIELMFKVANCLKKEKGYDLLISIAVPYPIHWGVSIARKRSHRIAETWVADCGDPYMGSQTDSFRKMFYFKFFEKWFSRKCDFISIPFDALISKFYPEFHSKIVTIPQGFKTDEVLVAKFTQNDVVTFAFAGSIIPGIRDLDQFFDFLTGVEMDFRFIIYTKQPFYYTKYKMYFGERLEIYEYLPRLQLLYELSKCDFLINVDTVYDSTSINTAFPSKLIDYSLTKRPILNICSNSIHVDIIKEFLGGIYDKKRIIDISNYRIESVCNKFLKFA